MVNFLKIRAILVVVCLVSVADGIAQNFSHHNWYFGNSVQGIRFNRTNDSAMLVTNQAIPFGIGGSAVATDPTNGNLLFYTDGQRVFNLAHMQMPGGVLNANTSANQPVAISPVPGQATQYYIFTRDGAGSVFRTIVDLSLPGSELAPTPPLGNIVVGSLNTPMAGLTARSEAMITVPHANGTDFWLITHADGTDDYLATLIDATGLFPPTPSPAVTGLTISAANFSYHEGSGKIAVSPRTADRNVAILNFDNSTGAISFDQFVLNSGVSSISGQSIYDTEWSSTGRFLYISRHGEAGIPADIIQYDLNNPGNSLATVLDFVPNRSYGLQIAPDSAIYHLYQETAGGSFFVGRLTNIDSVAPIVLDSVEFFGTGLNFNGTQFPAFTPRSIPNLTVTFVTDGTCSNSPVSFYPTVTPTADSLVWDFGDGQGSNQWSPIHAYQNGGAFNVGVTAFLNGNTATFNANILLTQFDLQLTLVQDTTACECELPVNNGIPPCSNDTSDDFSVTVSAQGGSPTSYIWSNGDTGPTLTPDSAGYYYVVVTDGSGCTGYAGVNVREYDAIDQRANIWYFGQNAGIDFNAPITAISGPLNTPEGCSVISDRNGQVIFSTDGFRVYDRNDVEITSVNGSPILYPPGIGGESTATQSALIIPVPGDETLYYIFTTQEVHGGYAYELRYSLYDIKLNNGDGGLAECNQLLFSRSTERITGDANWLIAHEYGNNSFRAYQITPLGISNPVISSIGSDHLITEEYNGQGYMELAGGNQLVVALPTFNTSNFLEFFDFDNTTGIVSNFRSVNLNATAEQVYGVEFAGNKVFATLRGTPNSFLREMYIDFQGNPVLIPPAAPSGPIAAELGAIQTGPDGEIYVAVNNQAALGTIQVNADTLQLSNFVVSSFTLAGGTLSHLGLPNFIQSVGAAPMQASMLVAGLCLGDSTTFTGSGTDIIDEFEWSFGDGFGAATQVAQHEYAAAGTYLVTLRVTNRCGLDTLLTQSITITAPPANPTFLPIGQQPVLCSGPLTLEAEPAAPVTGNSYLWSNGDTTRTTIITQQSTVGVVITNAQGCTSSGSVLVVDNRPQVDLGPDQTICQNTPVAPLNAQNLGSNYQWFLNDVNNGNVTQTQLVSTVTPGVFEYKARINDPVTLCVATDSVIFTINASPSFTAIPTNTSICGADDGQIALNILGPANTLFSYLVVGTSTGTILQDVDQGVGAVLPPFAPLPADTYVVQVSDQVSGCATTNTALINDNAFTITSVLRQNNCDPIDLTVTHTSALPFTYNVIDNTTGLVVASIVTPISGSPFTITGINSGTYVVQMISGGCSFSSPAQTFTQDPEVSITGFTIDGCTTPISVGVTGGTGWTWTGPNITSSNTIQTITATPPQGNQIYTVRVTGAGCPLDTAVTVFVNNNAVVDFIVPNGCADQVTLSATVTPPLSSYTFRWYRNGILIPGGQSIIATFADNGIAYRVEAVSTLSGCVFSSTSKAITVIGDFEVTMATTPPCPGIPFTLTASPTLSGVPQSSGVSFQWEYEGTNVGTNSSTHQDTQEGLYKVTASITGCDAEVQQPIHVFGGVASTLPSRALICPSPANPNLETREVLLDAGPGFISYEWYQNDVLSSNTNQTFLVVEPATYRVELISPFGCPSSDQTEVVEECNPRILAPTAFRPGSSITKNSTFYIFTYFVADEDFELFIYNRWGELVFQGSGLEEEIDQSKRSKQWNGGYNNSGQLLPAGTYSYIVKYKRLFGDTESVQEKRGGVVLLR